MTTTKTINLLLAVLLTFGLLLTGLPGDIWAEIVPPQGGVTISSMEKGTVESGKAVGGEIDINTADQEMLITVPGIGPVTAQAIVQYRETNGRFNSLDELTGVKGIGPKSLNKLKPYLRQF